MAAVPRTMARATVLFTTEVPNSEDEHDYGNEHQKGDSHDGDVLFVKRIEVCWEGKAFLSKYLICCAHYPNLLIVSANRW